MRLNYPLSHILKIKENKSIKVRKFIIPKSSNPQKFREIVSPANDYKILLRHINKFLLQKAKLPRGVCGGIVNKKLIDMVKPHCGREAVYVVDLKDFYPTITKNRILKMFLNSSCSREIADLLSELVTFENRLPQGFPTSTMISNIVTFKLDIDHLNISQKYNLNRTRWIDDIVFSGGFKDIERARYYIDKSIAKNGFIVNVDKQKLRKRNQDPIAVGLSLNKHKPYVPNKIIEHLEFIINFGIEFGQKKASEVFRDEYRGKDLNKSLEGKINYIEEFNPIEAKRLSDALNIMFNKN